MLALAAFALVRPVHLFLSENGDDRQSGASKVAAVRTFDRLTAVLKALPSRGNTPLVVDLDGTIRVTGPIVLGPEFSNTIFDGHGRASISGGVDLGKPVSGSFNGHSCWDFAAPSGVEPKQLFVGDQRRERPRLPQKGFFTFEGFLDGEEKSEWNKPQRRMRFRVGDIPAGADLSDAEIVAHHFWVTSILPVASVDDANRIVTFSKPSVFKLADDYTGGAAPYSIENVGAAFATPGQWYFDRKAGKIHYLPLPGETMAKMHPVVAVAPALLRVEGAKGLVIKGIRFAHTQWSYPEGQSGDGQAAVGVPAAVTFNNAESNRLERCDLSHLGTYAVELAGNSRGNSVSHCTMTDLGGGGVKLNQGTEGSVISDCTIDGGGRIFAPAVGVWIGNSGHNEVVHNRIHDLFYTGISVGWTWGYGPSNAVANKIEYNAISKIGQGQLSDMGGIYTLGVSPGTTLRYNRIDDVAARGYGGWGIYTDEGSSGILIENNVVTNTKTGGFHQHYGKENIVRNNVFAYAKQDGQIIRTREEDHISFSFEHNVILWRGTPLLGSNWTNGEYIFGHNLLCRQDGSVVLPAKDQGSLIAPALKVDKKWMPPKNLAEKIGFTLFNINTAGPRN